LVTYYRKGLSHPPPDMQYIDYGLLILTSGTVTDYTVSGQVADLSPMLARLSRRRLLSGYEASRRFFEIGTPAGIAELDEYLQRMTG
jgi:N-acetyl-alpha-D-muramate 1-phosphate uridylyltransferase